MKIMSSFTHPHAIPDQYLTILLRMKKNKDFFKNTLYYVSG